MGLLSDARFWNRKGKRRVDASPMERMRQVPAGSLEELCRRAFWRARSKPPGQVWVWNLMAGWLTISAKISDAT